MFNVENSNMFLKPALMSFFGFRFPIAIKKPHHNNDWNIKLLVEEAKTMLKVDEYHENIVNLQGITCIWDFAKHDFFEVRKLSHLNIFNNPTIF